MGHKGAAVRTEIVIRLLLVIIGTERLAPIHQTPACPPVEIFVWISVNVSSHASSGGGERWHLNQVRFAFKLSSSRMVDLSTRVSSALLSSVSSLLSLKLWKFKFLQDWNWVSSFELYRLRLEMKTAGNISELGILWDVCTAWQGHPQLESFYR